MKYIGPILLFLLFTSPLTFILSGCQWKPDGGGTSTRAEAGSSWVITKVGEPLPTESEVKPQTKPLPKIAPQAAPATDNVDLPPKYAPLKFPEPDRTPPKPLTAEQRAGLSNGEVCTDGSCSVQGGGGFRLFPRLRGRR